jgi:hypothetical protein
MVSFSQRMRISPTRVEIQRDGMDDLLRNSLWNVVYTVLETPLGDRNPYVHDAHRECREVFETLWTAFFKVPVHEIHTFSSERLIATLREPFLIVWPWWKVYDFLEFLPSAFRGARYYTPSRGVELRQYLNVVLEREMSAYRFVDDVLTPITDVIEIETIEHAVNAATPEPWVTHLRSSLAHLSSRAHPDYVHAIEEAMLSVSAVCQGVAHDPKATVADVIDHLDIRPAMRDAFARLYAWEPSGIDPPGFAEAKFMLVACSGFVNFVLQKTG